MNKPNIFKRVAYRVKIKKIVKPFIDSYDKKLEYFCNIEICKKKKFCKIIDSLNKYEEFYNDIINRVNELDKSVKQHNEDVTFLNNYTFDISMAKFLNNPNIIEEDKLKKEKELSDKLIKFKNVDNDKLKKANDVIEIVNNYTEILNQYDKKNNIHSLFNEDCYFDNKKFTEITNSINDIKNSLGNKKFYNFDLYTDSFIKNQIIIHNNEFIQKHLNEKIFDDINGKSLDNDQRSSVLKDELSNITIAGAGSGKTLTICGKVKYLLSKGIKGNEILLLSYSKKSADDLESKIKSINRDLHVGTFHKIGLEILKASTGQNFMVEDQFRFILENYFKEELKKDSEMMKDVLNYYAYYLSRGDDKKFDNNGELFEDLKKEDLTTLKDSYLEATLSEEKLQTFKKEYVKSVEELTIANFYFLNGIKYTYEKPYEIDTSSLSFRQYTPDFYLDDYKIYHEHYGIDKEGRAKQYNEPMESLYIEGIEWKRKIHLENNTICLETYSYENEDGVLLENLTKKLVENGVELKPLGDEELYNNINSIYCGKKFSSFINLICSFICLYKSRYDSESYFDEIYKSDFKNTYFKKRAKLFLKICKKLYIYYRNYLNNENKIDFDDMILKSSVLVCGLSSFKYKYIIVDEFQDISYSRANFLKSLIKHGDSKLFVVGDDWQAIYRFSGCDLDYFINFEKYFGKCEISKISCTHRNSQELQDIASSFIMKNKKQIKKNIHSDKHLSFPIKLVYCDEKHNGLMSILSEISKRDNKASVLLLGRNNHDIDKLLNKDFYFVNSVNERNFRLKCNKFKDLDMKYCTVHKSKGLEDDYVILINADGSKYGFPNQIEDDPLINLVLSNKEEVEFAEERRLWYVALTRTRKFIYILVQEGRESMFVDEIKDACEHIHFSEYNCEEQKIIPCPNCKTGHLIKRINNDNNSEFYSCSNYPYCDYTIDIKEAKKVEGHCPICGDFLIKRNGKYGEFYGCHSYPYCKYTKKVNK